jgi:GT2 family glycosyltransferase
VLVLDNASDDGSADAVRALDMDVELIERESRTGKAANDSLLLERAQGEFCLLLNEDSELLPGAVEASIAC